MQNTTTLYLLHGFLYLHRNWFWRSKTYRNKHRSLVYFLWWKVFFFIIKLKVIWLLILLLLRSPKGDNGYLWSSGFLPRFSSLGSFQTFVSGSMQFSFLPLIPLLTATSFTFRGRRSRFRLQRMFWQCCLFWWSPELPSKVQNKNNESKTFQREGHYKSK